MVFLWVVNVGGWNLVFMVCLREVVVVALLVMDVRIYV